MTEPYIVEVWGKPAGVVVKEGNAFRFSALAPPFFALHGAQFTTPGHARLAAARLDLERGRAPVGSAFDLPDRSLGRASHWSSSPPCGS